MEQKIARIVRFARCARWALHRRNLLLQPEFWHVCRLIVRSRLSTIGSPMASTVLLRITHLETWSDRRFGADCCRADASSRG